MERMLFQRAALVAIGLACLSPLKGSDLAEARALVEKWVQVEETLSRESVAWEEKKTHMLELNELAQVEISSAREQLADLEAHSNAADERRESLLERKQQAEQRLDRISEFVASFEQRIRNLEPGFPPPLKMALSPLMDRIPEDEDLGRIGIAERMQTAVAILSQVMEFDAKVSVEVELRDFGSGEAVEVKTLWLGLGAGFYVYSTGQDAGSIAYADGDWKWQSQPELKARIQEAMALAEGLQQNARFLSLPVAVQ